MIPLLLPSSFFCLRFCSSVPLFLCFCFSVSFLFLFSMSLFAPFAPPITCRPQLPRPSPRSIHPSLLTPYSLLHPFFVHVHMPPSLLSPPPPFFFLFFHRLFRFFRHFFHRPAFAFAFLFCVPTIDRSYIHITLPLCACRICLAVLFCPFAIFSVFAVLLREAHSVLPDSSLDR